jgi:hypothetical protein
MNMSVGRSTRDVEYSPNADLDAEIVDGEAFVWDPAGQALHRLSTTATLIWTTCSTWMSMQQIADAVACVVGETTDHVDEIEACLENLARRGLLDVRETDRAD